jgi:DNA-binding transcriptional MerR regulator
MRFGWALLAGLICLIIWLLRNAAGEMLKEEMQTRLCRIPNAVIRAAVLRLPKQSRSELAEEWRSELAFVVNDTEGLPVTRLLRGIRFAGSLLWTARQIADELAGGPESVGYRGPTACAAAGITYRQLDYWARTGLVQPSMSAINGSGAQRLYSFRDILVLKVMKRLLDTGISLQQIRAAVHHLRVHGTADLSQVTLMIDGDAIYECISRDEVVDLLRSGQGVFGIALGRVWHEIEGDLAVLPAVRASDGSIFVPESGAT